MDSDLEDYQEIDIDQFIGKPTGLDKGLEFPEEINLQLEQMFQQQNLIQPQIIQEHMQQEFDIEKFRSSVALINQKNIIKQQPVSQSQSSVKRPISEQAKPKNPNQLSKPEERKVQNFEGWEFQRQDVALAFRERFRKLQKKKQVHLNADQRLQKFRKFA